MNAQPGSIILQPLSFDPKSACVALHELTLLRVPRFTHCGIYDQNGQMFTASGKVEMQDAGAVGNIAAPYTWKDWQTARTFLSLQVGKPYDWAGWILCGIEPFARFFSHPPISNRAYLCSTLVAAALLRDDPQRFAALNSRCTTPDDVARAIGAIS